MVQEFYTFEPGVALQTRLASSSSHSPSGVPVPAFSGGRCSKARATTNAHLGGILLRLRRLRVGGPRHATRPCISALNRAARASADAVPLESALGASSRGGAVTYDTGRRPDGTEESEPPASICGGVLGGPQRGCARSLPLSPSDRSERLAMDFFGGVLQQVKSHAPTPPTWRAN